MKIIASGFAIILHFALFSQSDTLDLEAARIIYKDILASDQTNIDAPDIRKGIFEANFNTIIRIIKKQGSPSFPKTKRNQKAINTIKTATSTTFVHILQTKPELLLNEETIGLIKNEIVLNRLSPRLVKDILSVFQYDHDMGISDAWTDEVETYFYTAIREWDIKLYAKKK